MEEKEIMKFKTAISLLLSMVLLGFTVFTIPAFAEDTFDINDYSIEDLQYMTPEEKIKLISDYVNTCLLYTSPSPRDCS